MIGHYLLIVNILLILFSLTFRRHLIPFHIQSSLLKLPVMEYKKIYLIGLHHSLMVDLSQSKYEVVSLMHCILLVEYHKAVS